MNKIWGRVRLSVLALVYLLANVFALYCSSAMALEVGDQAPDWKLSSADGKVINFYQATENKPVVLFFWATWCPYCEALLPHLDQLRKDFSQQGVVFYALNIWENKDPTVFFAEKEIGFKLLLEAGAVAKQYDVKGTPGLMVIDRQKKLRYVRKSGTGEIEAKNQVTEILKTLLNPKSPSSKR